VKPAGIILAAGESSRMGKDKALLPYAGTTFIERLIDLFLPRVSPLIVVLGHNAGRILVEMRERPGVQVAINYKYKDGQLSSLKIAIAALPPDAVAALVTLVDHPAVGEATLDAILAHATAPLVIPRYNGRRGHPVLLSRRLLDKIAALPADASAKQVIHAHLAEAVLLDVDDPGVLRDVDTPADWKRLNAKA
jgi:molybdenum cofactor cytidylyltransferase